MKVFKVLFPKESLFCFLNFQLPNAIFRCNFSILSPGGPKKGQLSDPQELAAKTGFSAGQLRQRAPGGLFGHRDVMGIDDIGQLLRGESI